MPWFRPMENRCLHVVVDLSHDTYALWHWINIWVPCDLLYWSSFCFVCLWNDTWILMTWKLPLTNALANFHQLDDSDGKSTWSQWTILAVSIWMDDILSLFWQCVWKSLFFGGAVSWVPIDPPKNVEIEHTELLHAMLHTESMRWHSNMQRSVYGNCFLARYSCVFIDVMILVFFSAYTLLWEAVMKTCRPFRSPYAFSIAFGCFANNLDQFFYYSGWYFLPTSLVHLPWQFLEMSVGVMADGGVGTFFWKKFLILVLFRVC